MISLDAKRIPILYVYESSLSGEFRKKKRFIIVFTASQAHNTCRQRYLYKRAFILDIIRWRVARVPPGYDHKQPHPIV